jgi:hypothetical protein
MTLQLLHYEFPYIRENLIFFFVSALCLFVGPPTNAAHGRRGEGEGGGEEGTDGAPLQSAR